MGFHLTSALDPERRRACEANAAALQESLMRHMQKASRHYADPLGEPGEFEFTVMRYGKPESTITAHCENELDASLRAVKLFGEGAVVTINRAGSSWLEQSMGRA